MTEGHPALEADLHPTRQLAEFVANLSIDSIPPRVRERVKWLILDSIGCMVGGLGGEETAQVAALADAIGPTGDSTALGHGRRSLAAATLLNAYLISASTAMDSYVPASYHMTPGTVPPALAIAEQRHSSGADLIVAIAAGLEVGVRVADGIDLPAFRARGWHAPGVVGPFSAAAAVSRLVGSDARTIAQAFGLAGSQAAGTFASWGTPTVKFHQARGALSGLIAAVLAGEGFPYGSEFLSASDGGLFKTYSDGGFPDRVIEGLGERWGLEQISIRRWPSGHPAIATALFEWLAQPGSAQSEVTNVVVHVPTPTWRQYQAFAYPASQFEAMNSISYQVAVVVNRRRLTLADYQRDTYLDDGLRKFATESVSVEPDGSLGREMARVDFRRTDGDTATGRCDVAKGSPLDPLSEVELIAKFRELCTGRLSAAAMDAAIDTVMALDDSEDCSSLLSQLALN